MPFNGSGVFSVYTPGTPYVTGTVISSTVANNVNTDFATGLSTCLLKNGTQTVTADIPMGGFKLTGLGAGSAAGNSVRYEQTFLYGVNNTSDLLWVDATYDIGKTGATRPRDIFLSRNATVGNNLSVSGAGTVGGALSVGGGASAAGVTSTSTITGTALVVTGNSAPTAGFYLPSTNQIGTTVNSVERTRVIAATTANAGQSFFEGKSIAGATFVLQDVSGTAPNAANAAMKVSTDGTTGRSINAGGTINASAADAAHYEKKRDDCGPIVKGQIVGFDANGLLTDKWNLAVSFRIKATNPGFVMGDAWSAVCGEEPRHPGDEPKDCTLAQAAKYQEDLYAYLDAKKVFDAKLEAERVKYDRVCTAGKVPVNVLGAKPGQWIVPVQDGDGIGGKAVDIFDPKHVGLVRRVLPDGRAEVFVG